MAKNRVNYTQNTPGGNETSGTIATKTYLELDDNL